MKKIPPAYVIQTDIDLVDGDTLVIMSNTSASFTRCPKCDNLIRVEAEVINCDECDFSVGFANNLEEDLTKDVETNYKEGVGL